MVPMVSGATVYRRGMGGVVAADCSVHEATRDQRWLVVARVPGW